MISCSNLRCCAVLSDEMAGYWRSWLDKSSESDIFEDGYLKPNQKVDSATVNALITEFRKIMEEHTVIDITCPALVYIAAYGGSNPGPSCVEALVAHFSIEDLKEAKNILKSLKFDIDQSNRQKNVAQATAEDIVKAMDKMNNSDKASKFRYQLKACDLHKAPSYKPDELANRHDSVRRMNLIETEMKALLASHHQLSTQVAENTAKLVATTTVPNIAKNGNAQQKSVWNVPNPALKAPPLPNRFGNHLKNNIQSAGSAGSPGKRKRTDSENTNNQSQSHDQGQSAKDGDFVEVNRSKKNFGAKGTKKTSEESKLLGGTDTVSIVIYGVNKRFTADNIKEFTIGEAAELTPSVVIPPDDVTAELLTTFSEARTHTYKVTVHRKFKDVVSNDSFWPEYTSWKPFIYHRKKQTTDPVNGSG